MGSKRVSRRRFVAGTAALSGALVAAPFVRGACSTKDGKIEGAWQRPVLEFRTNDAILNFVNGKDVARYAKAGVITPDHVIRTRGWPLIVPAPAAAPFVMATLVRIKFDDVETVRPLVSKRTFSTSPTTALRLPAPAGAPK